MTSEQLEYIGKRLSVDSLPVTSIFLSRIWNISSKKASEILSDFYEKSKTNPSFKDINVKCVVCGDEKYNGNQRNADILVKIVDMNDLDDINKQFNNVVSTNVYSIHLNKDISISNIIESCKVSDWTYNVENMTSCGLIQTETSGIINPNIESESKTNTIKTESKPKHDSEPKSNETQRPVYQSRKAQSNPTSGSSNTPALSMFTSRYTSRKADKRTPEPTKQKPTKRAKTMSAVEQQQRDQEVKLKEKQTQKEYEELQDLMDVDFSDDDDFKDGVVIDDNTETDKDPKTEYKFNDIDVAESDNEKEEIKPIKETEKIIKETNKYDDTFDDSFDFDDLKDIKKPEPKPKPKPKPEPKPEPEPEPLPDVETYTDSDGFIVRKINRKEPSKPKRATPTNRVFTIDTQSTKSGSGVKKQGNLMSFFKKK